MKRWWARFNKWNGCVVMPERPMTPAVEAAAGCIHRLAGRCATPETHRADQSFHGTYYTDIAQAALTAAKLPELLAVVEAARELYNADTFIESTGATSEITLRHMRARQNIAAALANLKAQ